jgi:hypothetical protein
MEPVFFVFYSAKKFVGFISFDPLDVYTLQKGTPLFPSLSLASLSLAFLTLFAFFAFLFFAFPYPYLCLEQKDSGYATLTFKSMATLPPTFMSSGSKKKRNPEKRNHESWTEIKLTVLPSKEISGSNSWLK